MDEADPHRLSNLEYERRLLGAALLHPAAREAISSRLSEANFYHPPHKALYRVIAARATEGASFDLPLLRNDLRQIGPQYEIDDSDVFVAELREDAGAEAAVEEYVTGVKAASDARDLAQLGRQITMGALSTDGDPSAVQKVLADSDESLRAMTDKVIAQPWQSIAALAEQVSTGEAAQVLFPSGFPDLDRTLQGGFRGGQLVVIAARPGQGKSTLNLDLCRSASLRHGVPGLSISLEMSGTENAARLMAAEGGVPLTRIQEGKVTERDRDCLDDVVERIGPAPYYVIDAIEPSLQALTSTIIAAHRRLGVGFVSVDYAQLVTSDGSGPNTSREQIVANISRTMKGLANSLGIVVFLVAQLNRGPEQRTDKRPQISDLRESGQLEQDGDIIFLIWNPESADPTERMGETDLIVAKHRNGPTGTVPLNFQRDYARFVSAAREADGFSPHAQAANAGFGVA